MTTAAQFATIRAEAERWEREFPDDEVEVRFHSGDLYGEPAVFLNITVPRRLAFMCVSLRLDGSVYGDDEPVDRYDDAIAS